MTRKTVKSRQQRRVEKRIEERKSQAYDKRKYFTKEEVESMNETAYNLGVEHALEAAWMKLGIGPARQEKIKEGLKLLQSLDFDWRLNNRG